MLRRLVILVVLFLIVVAGLGIYKAMSIRSQIAMFTAPKPPIHVAATSAEQLQWQTRLPAIGTLTSALGVELTAEVSGVVSEVLFESGQNVEAGQDLVRMAGDVEQASLATAEAQAELARLEFNRQQNLLQRQSISQSQYDQARSSLRQATARADELRATLEKKRIQAPFSGRIGISRVDPGDYLSPGTNIATLQNLDRLYVDFFMPEQYYPQLAIGQIVRVKVAAFPNEVFEGRVAAINPKVEATSRNLQIRASVANPDEKLLPGMFAELELVLPGESEQVVVPETAMTFTLYGNSVYVITSRRDEAGEVVTDETGEPVLEVQRRFVKTGQRRDGQVVVLEGLESGEQVVISGQLKLDNGARVAIDNSNPL